MKNIAVFIAAAMGMSSHMQVFAGDHHALPAAPLPLDISNTCQFLLKGSERLVYRATTTIMDGEPVFQGYDIHTCQAQEKFYYRDESERVWNLDKNLEVSTHDREGYTTGGAFTGCPDEEMDVIRWGQPENDKMKSYYGIPCWTLPVPAEALPLDITNDCLFAMTGYENYTLLPTTMTKHGEAVYQGYDNETCQTNDRLMFYTWNRNEWNVDKDLNESPHSNQGGRLGYINPTFRGCTAEADAVIWVPTYGHQNNSKIHRIESSPCFVAPTPAPTTPAPTTAVPATTVAPTVAPTEPHVQPSTEPTGAGGEQPPPLGTPNGVVVGAAAGAFALLGAGAYGATRIIGNGDEIASFMDIEAQTDGDDLMDRDNIADVGVNDYI